MWTDPRPTRVGAFLCKWSMDELPMLLINVLRADLSLVGPRPALPREMETVAGRHPSMTNVKPGVTGLWQVSGRYALTFDEMVALDWVYVENWSLMMDLRILCKTIAVTVTRRGVY